MAEDKTRNWSMIALIAFNITVIICIICYTLKRGSMSALIPWDFVVAIVLGTIVACGAFVAAMKIDK